jgi:tetratricopeptide (TPR) repeat protein
VLSEEALILAAAVGACALLVLGVLELVWPTRPRHARRLEPDPAPARPPLAAVPPRPAQSILPRRLIDSPSASRPAGGFVFPPPADYVPPPPREDVRPGRAVGHVVPGRRPDPEPQHPLEATAPPEPIEAPVARPEPVYIAPPYIAPPEPAYVTPPAVEVEPEPIDPELAPADVEPLPLESEPPRAEPQAFEPEPLPRLESEPSRFDPGPSHLVSDPSRFEPEPPRVEAEPPPFAAEARRFEPQSPRFEPERPRFELESQRPAPERAPFEPEPRIAEPAGAVVEPAAKPIEAEAPVIDIAPSAVEPAPPNVEPERRPIALIAPAFEPVAPPSEPVPPPAQPAESSEPPRRRRRSKTSPHARPHRVLRPAIPDEPLAEQPPTDPAPPAPIEAATGTPPPPGVSAEIETKLSRDTPLVEHCFALYQERRFDEVLSVGQPALAEMQRPPAAGTPRETAALWSVVGLAKQALGDDDGAHAALESSIACAVEPERSTYRRHLATLALEAAQARLVRAGSHDAGERMAVIRTAIAWTERGLAAVPADPGLTDARAASHEALWQAYEQAATALLQRQEFPGARQILHEALADPKLPAARAAGFRGLLSGTFGSEIGQLTAQAILGMQEGRESEALGALQRAEELLRTIPTDALPPRRRDEVDQRLWWGYAELGSRRLDAGDYEEALDPLIHALRFTSIGAERQAETRSAVVRTLEGIAAVRALSIRRLAEAGSRDEAIVAAGELHGLVKRGLELGLSEDDLLAAFARVRRLCEELGMDTRA